MRASEFLRLIFHNLPMESAQAVKPLMDLAARESPSLRGRSLSLDQLERMIIGDLMLMLSGHPSIVFDGGERGEATAPQSIQYVAQVFSEAVIWAAAQCPDVDIDMHSIRQERLWALAERLASPGFVEEVFTDPACLDVLTPRVFSLLMTCGRGFLEAFLGVRWDWYFENVLSRPELREIVAFEHPHVVLTGLAHDRELCRFVDGQLRNELQLGLSRMTTSERAGVRSLYAAELESIGLRI